MICRVLALNGADAFFAHWNAYADGPEALLAELGDAEARADGMELVHLSLPDSPERLLDVATERLGSPSILVNNAAHPERDGYQSLDAANLDAH